MLETGGMQCSRNQVTDKHELPLRMIRRDGMESPTQDVETLDPKWESHTEDHVLLRARTESFDVRYVEKAPRLHPRRQVNESPQLIFEQQPDGRRTREHARTKEPPGREAQPDGNHPARVIVSIGVDAVDFADEYAARAPCNVQSQQTPIERLKGHDGQIANSRGTKFAGPAQHLARDQKQFPDTARRPLVVYDAHAEAIHLEIRIVRPERPDLPDKALGQQPTQGFEIGRRPARSLAHDNQVGDRSLLFHSPGVVVARALSSLYRTGFHVTMRSPLA